MIAAVRVGRPSPSVSSQDTVNSTRGPPPEPSGTSARIQHVEVVTTGAGNHRRLGSALPRLLYEFSDRHERSTLWLEFDGNCIEKIVHSWWDIRAAAGRVYQMAALLSWCRSSPSLLPSTSGRTSVLHLIELRQTDAADPSLTLHAVARCRAPDRLRRAVGVNHNEVMSTIALWSSVLIDSIVPEGPPDVPRCLAVYVDKRPEHQTLGVGRRQALSTDSGAFRGFTPPSGLFHLRVRVIQDHKAAVLAQPLHVSYPSCRFYSHTFSGLAAVAL